MRVYLDNAATSFPKPPSVYDAVDFYQRHVGVAIGRGSYRQSLAVQRIVDQCRQQAARLLGAENPDRIVFTFSGTDGLNMVLLGICRPSDHVVTSVLEHNSVLRCLREMQERRGIEITTVAPRADGRIEPADVRRALRPSTRLVAILHASNVTGVVQPIAEIGELAQRNGSFMMTDAAQTAGHLPIDVSRLPIDIVVCPGHKGLLGPLGTGIVYVRTGIEEHVNCFRLGGTGTSSEDDHHPCQMPERFEAGNHNVPGLVGLEAALAFLELKTIQAIHDHEAGLTRILVEGLRNLSTVSVYGHDAAAPHVGVVSFNVKGFNAHEVASLLDDSFGIQSRAGLHCAAGAHRSLGTFDCGGTIRFSVGPFTTDSEIEKAITSVAELT